MLKQGRLEKKVKDNAFTVLNALIVFFSLAAVEFIFGVHYATDVIGGFCVSVIVFDFIY